MRSALKRVFERVIVASGVAALARRRRSGGALILAYHDIVPYGEGVAGDRSLHLAQETFGRQLDTLMATHDVVPLTEILSGPVLSWDQRARVAITFDDAYLGAMTAGVAELRARGLPATMFIAPALLGQVTWWDLLGGASGDLGWEQREHALQALGGEGDRVRAWAASTGISTTQAGLARIATLDQLTDALRYERLVPAAHTWSHPNLCTLAGEALDTELRKSHDWLRERFADTLPVLAYPYGLHSAAVMASVARTGFSHALRVDGGWMAHDADVPAHAIPRFNVPAGLSDDGFVLRLAGIGTGR